jgi:hypothetical protein
MQRSQLVTLDNRETVSVRGQKSIVTVAAAVAGVVACEVKSIYDNFDVLQSDLLSTSLH